MSPGPDAASVRRCHRLVLLSTDKQINAAQRLSSRKQPSVGTRCCNTTSLTCRLVSGSSLRCALFFSFLFFLQTCRSSGLPRVQRRDRTRGVSSNSLRVPCVKSPSLRQVADFGNSCLRSACRRPGRENKNT